MFVDVVIARADLIDTETFRRLRAELPTDRQTRCDAYYREVDRYSSAVSFSLLQFLWAERFGIPMPAVVRGRDNKPYFDADVGAAFNISHDGAICVCVLTAEPVGIDVQTRVPFDEALFERIASVNEMPRRHEYERADDLSELWSRKEALIKRSGQGLQAKLPAIDTTTAAELVTIRPDALDAYISLSATDVTESTFSERVRVRELSADTTRRWRVSPVQYDLRAETRHRLLPSR